jgi:hypothetical protein
MTSHSRREASLQIGAMAAVLISQSRTTKQNPDRTQLLHANRQRERPVLLCSLRHAKRVRRMLDAGSHLSPARLLHSGRRLGSTTGANGDTINLYYGAADSCIAVATRSVRAWFACLEKHLQRTNS